MVFLKSICSRFLNALKNGGLSPSVQIILMFLAVSSGLWAGDVATFVDLGFSDDGKIYMFGQHGVLSPSLKPWAEFRIVDVNANNFTKDGRGELKGTPITAGQNGSGVFYKLLSNNSNLANRNGIFFQNQGIPLYISREEKLSARGEEIRFRDFLSGKYFTATIFPTVVNAPVKIGGGQNVVSSFYIALESLTQDGQVKNYIIGTPRIKRQNVLQYNFRKVLVDTNRNSIIFVIEMLCAAENGYDVRYMVEAQRL